MIFSIPNPHVQNCLSKEMSDQCDGGVVDATHNFLNYSIGKKRVSFYKIMLLYNTVFIIMLLLLKDKYKTKILVNICKINN